MDFTTSTSKRLTGIPNNWYAIIGGTFFMLMIGIIIKIIIISPIIVYNTAQ